MGKSILIRDIDQRVEMEAGLSKDIYQLSLLGDESKCPIIDEPHCELCMHYTHDVC